MNSQLTRVAADAVRMYFKSGEYVKNFNSKEVADMVTAHAAAAGVAAMGAGIVPGVGTIAAMGISVGAIWTMYYRIARYLGLSLAKEGWKAIASAVLSNIVTQLAGVLALEVAVGFVPGAGIIAAGIVNFGVTYAAGIVYLKALTGIFAAGKDPKKMTADDLGNYFSDAAKNVDAKSAFKESKSVFNEMKRDGSLKKKGKDTTITEGCGQ